ISQNEKDAENLFDHVHIRYRQREALTALKEAETLFVSQDYVAFEISRGKCNVVYINVFGNILEWKELNEHGEAVWKKKVVDYISDDESEGKNDSIFTMHSIMDMHERHYFDGFTQIW